MLALPPGGKGKRTLQCYDCDGPDPLKTDKATGWLKSELTTNQEKDMTDTNLAEAGDASAQPSDTEIKAKRLGWDRMIRDPSDGSVREKPETGIPASAGISPVIDTSTSGLPITKAKAGGLARFRFDRARRGRHYFCVPGSLLSGAHSSRLSLRRPQCFSFDESYSGIGFAPCRASIIPR